MAGVSARRAPDTRTAAKLLHALPKTRKTSPMRLQKSAAPKSEQVEVAMDNAQDAGDTDLLDHHDDGSRSSSLSEPDDDIDGSEDLNGPGDAILGHKPQPAVRSLEVDSEAETERLEQTPQKLRQHAESLGRTPSKLSQTAAADDELSEPPSPLPTGAGATSSTSTGATAGQKRKRSDTADSSLSSAESDIGESPRKRSHEMTADDQIHREEAMEETEPAEEMPARVEDTPTQDEVRDTPPVVAKGPKGRRGKAKGKKAKDTSEQPEAEVGEEVAEALEEPSEEDLLKTEEQQKAKKEASGLYDDVAKVFRSFRERLYAEQLATLDAELEMLEQPDCVHPEYLRQVACVDARLQKQIAETHAFFKYKARSVVERTLGERSQLHSQCYQSVRQTREDLLYKLGEEWYAIQRERRQSHQLDADDAYVYMYEPKKSALLRRQAKYNLELSILSGMAKHVGFPAAPDIQGAAADDLDQDLKAMKVSKSAPNPVAQSRPLYLAGSNTATQFIQNERIAHEQYLEQNPWARPQMLVHAHATPGISHTPDWADSSASMHVRQNAHLGHANSSPFATPVPQKHIQHLESSGAATIGMNSDGLVGSEAPMPSSVVAAPPTVDRMAALHQQGLNSNQTSPLAFPKVRENGSNVDPQGFRNISGMSGASTIVVPSDPAAAKDDTTPNKAFPGPLHPTEQPSEVHTFPTSQMHLHLGDEGKDVFASVGFRPQAGAFGTPAPLHAPQSTGKDGLH